MENNKDLLIAISKIYRNSQKYFDSKLAKYKIGSGQLIFILFINENEGTNSNEICRLSGFDKSTAFKSIKRLEEAGYIKVKTNDNDRRVKQLYTTNLANDLMNDLYDIRNEYYEMLVAGNDASIIEKSLQALALNSEQLDNEKEFSGLKIGGLQKTTLLDYPDKVACTIFMAGCNYKCPFCHNKDLVYVPENYAFYQPTEIMDFLRKRQGLLDGVCISGGEPLLQAETIDFIREIKALGYAVKLDTNGNYPERLKALLEEELLDYVAMDIKNSPEKYAQTVGLSNEAFSLTKIQQSIDILKQATIPYEFRTTVVLPYHQQADFEKIGQWLKGCKQYFLQSYEASSNVIGTNLKAPSVAQMQNFLTTVSKYISNAKIRGEE